MSPTIYQKRPWIPASDSFSRQQTALLRMVETLAGQIKRLRPERPRRLHLVGIGASHAAAAAPAHQLRSYGIETVRLLPNEMPQGAPDKGVLTIFISQSGRSAETVQIAEKIGAASCLALTNYHPSPLADVCGTTLNLGDHPDSSVSFTSFTGSMLALGFLADHWAGRSREEEWKANIRAAFSAVEVMDNQLETFAAEVADCPAVDFVAPASALSVAEEAALMFREGPRIFAAGYETRQYLHGPMDVAGNAFHIIFGAEREALLVDQLAERTSNLLFVTGRDAEHRRAAGTTLALPVDLDDGVMFAIAATLLAQRLTLHAARARSVDIDEAVFVRLDTKTDRGSRAA